MLLAVVLILIFRGASNFTDLGGDKIGIAGDVSECERLCWECCRAEDPVNECNRPQYVSCECSCLVNFL